MLYCSFCPCALPVDIFQRVFKRIMLTDRQMCLLNYFNKQFLHFENESFLSLGPPSKLILY
jgi:hypothetical protein